MRRRHSHGFGAVADKEEYHGDERYEQQLFEGLKDGSVVGKWFIPTCEILCGRDVAGRELQPDNLYDLSHTGDFAGTFTTVRGSGFAHWYCSSTELYEDRDFALLVDFPHGRAGWEHKRGIRHSCRPVRVELAL